MIPYVIEHSNPSDDIYQRSIYTYYYSSEPDTLNEHIITMLTEIMYEFCSYKYGHGINITSYDDFCYQYWKIKGMTMANVDVFNITYFENGWKNWNVADHKEEIYNSYVLTFVGPTATHTALSVSSNTGPRL